METGNLMGGGGLSFDSVKNKYEDFAFPNAKIKINGKELREDNLFLREFKAELTCELPASCCTFTLSGLYDDAAREFDQQVIDSKLQIGNLSEVFAGYGDSLHSVFYGYIYAVDYEWDGRNSPLVRAQCMDAKGLMMLGCSYRQRREKSYGECIKKIAQEYSSMISASDVLHTEKLDRDIEMNAESDYDFLCKAAKKLGCEFYISGKKLVFKAMMQDTSVLFLLDGSAYLKRYHIHYDSSGLAKKITVRATDDEEGKAMAATASNSSRYGAGSAYKKTMGQSEKVFIDGTVRTAGEAKKRAEAMLERLSWRFGTLRCTVTGIPELMPGHFLEASIIAKDVHKKFYMTKVTHRFSQGRYETEIEARLKSL